MLQEKRTNAFISPVRPSVPPSVCLSVYTHPCNIHSVLSLTCCCITSDSWLLIFPFIHKCTQASTHSIHEHAYTCSKHWSARCDYHFSFVILIMFCSSTKSPDQKYNSKENRCINWHYRSIWADISVYQHTGRELFHQDRCLRWQWNGSCFTCALHLWLRP